MTERLKANLPLSGTLAVTFLQSLFDVVESRGINRQQLMKAAQIETSLPDDKSQRISGIEYCRLLQSAAELCRDDHLGLHVGEAIKPGHYGVLGYACMSANTLQEVTSLMLRYQMLVSDIGSHRLISEGDRLKLVFDCSATPYPPRHLTEEHLSGLVVFSRWLTNTGTSPLAIYFQHPQPSDISEHQRIFNCPLLFNQQETAIDFPVNLLQQQLPQADPALNRVMDDYAEQQLTHLANDIALDTPLQRVIADLLKKGEPSLERLASQLEISARSLQRKLKEQGLSYSELLDQTRQQLAIAYFQKETLSLTDIAFLLGFSEQSAFQRAFKRWTGLTPGKYRKHQPPGK